MDACDAYLDALDPTSRATLAAVNRAGLKRLHEGLTTREAIAFVGAGASTPLYPLWDGVIGELVDAAADRLDDAEAETLRALAKTSPDAVVEVVRQQLRPEVYVEVLRELFRIRRDRASGRSWTATHELVARCDFRAVVTTNYDPGIVDARMRVRPDASATGHVTWADETAMDRWRSGDAFDGRDVLPVLYAHGHHNRPEDIVLATTDYRRAYAGKLARVLGELVIAGRLVWIGFSFADQRIAAILREVGETAGTRIAPGMAPRHVAIMPWDPDPRDGSEASDPAVLQRLCAIQYGAEVVLYPASAGDHAALGVLLASLAEPRFPAVAAAPAAPAAAGVSGPRARTPVVRWVHGGEPVEPFTGRVDELAKLDRWAADPDVRLVGVTAWGGAGKTALVTEWLARRDGMATRPGVRGLFAWSFYEDASEDAWAKELLAWAKAELGVDVGGERLGERVLGLVAAVPLVLVLDGLERVQEGPGGSGYGRLLGGVLRTVLTGMCRIRHDSIAILTSRFVFADLERFDGTAARMLDVPPLTAAEGSEALERAGGGWLPDPERRRLVAAVDGHALAVGALAGALAGRPPADDLAALVDELERIARTDARVARTLAFYADRLAAADRALVAIVALFQRPVPAVTVLALGGGELLDGVLRAWTAADVRAAVEQRVGGLLSWHGDAMVSAHPLVRDTFRPLALTAESARLASDLQLADLPGGPIQTREQGQRLVEIIELLLDGGQWAAADSLYRERAENGEIWQSLPAASLGKRCALAFVSTPERSEACRRELGEQRLGFYLNDVGLFAAIAGELAAAQQFLVDAIEHARRTDDREGLATVLQNWCDCLSSLGDTVVGRNAAAEALELAVGLGDDTEAGTAYAYLASAAHLAGATADAERSFVAADTISYAEEEEHRFSVNGSWWATMLCDTGRTVIARTLAEANLETSVRNGWNEDTARCERALARCDLADGATDNAEPRLRRAVATFRDGDYVIELAETLAVLAEQRRRADDLDEALHACEEAIEIVQPRALVPTLAAALAARARIRADQGTVDDALRARDDADHALRLATRARRLPWHELAALDAHAHIDRVTGVNGDWAARAADLRATLIPADLDPDPLATVEATVAARRASESADEAD